MCNIITYKEKSSTFIISHRINIEKITTDETRMTRICIKTDSLIVNGIYKL